MKQQFTLLPLFIVTMLAFLVPIIVSRIRAVRIPGVVLEILVGIIIGRSGLNIVHAGEYIDFLSIFGFAFLMFLSGYEIDFSAINIGVSLRGKATVRRLLKNNLLVGILIFLGTLILSAMISYFLFRQGYISNIELMTLILSTTSVGVVIPTLKDRGLLGEAFGQATIMAALVSDMATMVLLTGWVLMLTRGGSSLTQLGELLLVVVLFGFFYLIYQVGKWLVGVPFFRFIFNELAHAVSQLKVRGAIAIMLLFLVLSEWLGTEIILGAFLAGAILSIFASRTETMLSMKLDAIGYGFFIPIFFIMVGVDFNLTAITGSGEMWLLIPLLLGTAYLNKMIPSAILAPRFGWKKSLAGGMLLSSRLSLIIAATAIGRQMGLVTDSVNSAIIVIAVITSTMSPILFNRLHDAVDLGGVKIVILGAGKIGRALAQRLVLLNRNVMLIDNDQGSVEKALSLGLKCIKGDGCKPSVYRRVALDSNDILVAVTGSDDTNLKACEMGRRVFGVEKSIARDNNPANTDRFQAMGVRPMNLVQSAAITLENLVLRPEVFDLLADRHGDNGLLEITLRNRRVQGRKFSELPMVHHDMVILLIRRGRDLFFPDADLRLDQNDVLLVFGTAVALQKAEEFLGEEEGTLADV